jgi:hypothetical protein
MRRLWWALIPFVAALVAVRAWWAELADIVGLVTLVCALSGQSRLYRPNRDQTSGMSCRIYPRRQADR